MKSSVKILTSFSLGIAAGLLGFFPRILIEKDWSIYFLYALIFFVGVGVGSNEKALKILRKPDLRMFLIPLGVVAGTYAGILVFYPLIPGVNLKEALAVSSGFGYYSLSSVLITRMSGEMLGVAALISNITREIFTLVFTPLIVKYCGKVAPIMSGGATATDTTLPIITKFSGKEFALYAVFSGMTLTLLVPILITLLFKL
jgi:uncharacterized membrane protein YbjE (DUF340 family)